MEISKILSCLRTLCAANNPPVKSQWSPSSSKHREGSGWSKSLMCSDGTEGTGGSQRARVRTEWFPPLINSISLAHIPHFIPPVLFNLSHWRSLWPCGRFIEAPIPTVIYSIHTMEGGGMERHCLPEKSIRGMAWDMEPFIRKSSTSTLWLMYSYQLTNSHSFIYFL